MLMLFQSWLVYVFINRFDLFNVGIICLFVCFAVLKEIIEIVSFIEK